LLFIPFRVGIFRSVAIVLLISLHVGLLLCMELGLFPYISIIGWLALIPTWFWDKVSPRFRTEARAGLKIFYDGDCGFCKKTVLIIRSFFLLNDATIATAQSNAPMAADLEQFNTWIVVDAEGVETLIGERSFSVDTVP